MAALHSDMLRAVRRFAFMLVLAGCLPTVDVEPPRLCEALAVQPTPALIARDTVTTIDVPFIASDCLPEGVTVTVDVLDSENLPVQFEVALEQSGRSAIAHVELLPRHRGPLSIVAVFEPGLGRVVRSTVVVDSPAQSSFRETVETPCTVEALTTFGISLCQRPNTVTAWRDGMLLQSLPALGMAVSGETVWRIGPERFVDRGLDFLVREPDVALPFTFDGVLLADGPEVLWVVSDARATRLRFDGMGLVVSAELSLPRGLCEGAPDFGAAAGGLFLACRSRAAHSRLCRFEWLGLNAVRCTEFEGDLLGLDDDHLWVVTGDVLVRAGLDDSVRFLLPPRMVPRAPARFLDRSSWPIGVDDLGTTVLFTPQAMELAPTSVEVLSHGPRGVLVIRDGARGLLPR
jgi:hypothetical protein